MLRPLEGIVLKSQDYGETHKIITILTNELGKISAIARGVNKPKSRLSAVSQVFIQADFLLYVSTGLSTVQQGQIIHSYRKIREDIVKTAYAAYIIELTDKILEEKEKDPFIYKQLNQTLTWINDHFEFMIPVIMYELKLYNKGGFAPVINNCVHCGSKHFPFVFSIQEGGLLCGRCRNLDNSAINLSNSLVKLLPILLNVGLDRVSNISVKAENQQLLRQILDHYYDQFGGFHLKSRKFLRQLDMLK